jgi:hypothetical protein
MDENAGILADESHVELSLSERLVHSRRPVRENVEKLEIQLPDGPATITVRGLSRNEHLVASKRFGEDDIAKEQWLASKAMIDPPLSPEEVRIWQEVSGPQEINQVMMKVNELSGISAGAEKS